MSVKAFERSDLPALFRLLGELAAERWPTPSPLMNSDLAWQLPGSGPKENIRLWFEGDDLVAYAWFQPPGHLHFDARPARVDRLEEALVWARSRRDAFPPDEPFHLGLGSMDEWADAVRGIATRPPATRRLLTVQAFAGDDRESVLRASGFELTAHEEPFLTLDLRARATPGNPPEGFVVRPVRADEYEARVLAHRAAWAPSTGFDAAFYERVRSIAPPYDGDLDLVAVTDDGRIGCTAIFWADPISRIGSLEPFGTDPHFRGSGISQALLREGLARLGASGMRGVRIYTAGFNAPAQRLYASVGFAEVARFRTWIGAVDGRAAGSHREEP